MKKRITLGLVAVGMLALAAPMASASTKAAPPVPTCVVVNGPSSVHVQVGYAPDGPSDCQQLP